jgi:hypothetical protein
VACGPFEIGCIVVFVRTRGCELSVWPRSFPFGALRFGLGPRVAPHIVADLAQRDSRQRTATAPHRSGFAATISTKLAEVLGVM